MQYNHRFQIKSIFLEVLKFPVQIVRDLQSYKMENVYMCMYMSVTRIENHTMGWNLNYFEC